MNIPASIGAALRFSPAKQGILIALMMAAAVLNASVAHGAYPEKAIQVIVPYSPGGATDALARTIGQKVSDSLNQPVVIDNRPGGSGITGMAAAARAPADGYTILFVAVSDMAISAAAFQSQPVHLIRHFAPVAGVATAPHILVVPASVPAQSLAELIRYLKADPGKYNYASNTWLSHVESELFKLVAGVDMVHVPYKGGPQAVVDLISGRTSMMFLSSPAAVPHMKSGKLRVLAVASNRRLASLPNVPTVEESGVQGFDANNLFGFAAAKGTPQAAITVLSKAIEAALTAPDLIQRLESQGLDMKYSSPDEFGRMTERDFRAFESIVKKANVKLD